MILEAFPRLPALSPNLRNRLKLIFIASRVPIAPALLILGDEIANLTTLLQVRQEVCYLSIRLLRKTGEFIRVTVGKNVKESFIVISCINL